MTTATPSCVFTLPANLGITVSVTDLDGQVSGPSPPLSFNVFSQPVSFTPTTSRSSVDVAQSVSFTGRGVGGSGGYAFSWKGTVTPCTGLFTPILTCTPKAPGLLTVWDVVTDTNELSSSLESSINVTVFPDPTVALPTFSRSPVYVGQSIEISAKVTGGSGNETFRWLGLPSECPSANTSNIVCIPQHPGSYPVSVSGSDGNGLTFKSGLAVLQVLSAPSISGGVAPAIVLGTTVALVLVAGGVVLWLVRRRNRQARE